MLVDGRKREHVGAHWVNGVEARLFGDLGLGEPTAPVVHHIPTLFHLEADDGSRVTCESVPLVDVDMGPLNRDLLARAEAAGADLRFGSRFQSLLFDGEAVTGCALSHEGGRDEIRAALTVDASGYDSVVRRALPEHLVDNRPYGVPDTCVALQHVREIADPAAARRFLDENRLRPGETLSWAGVRGGFSILNVNVDLEHGEVSFLTGAMMNHGQQAAVDVLEQGLERTGFAGAKKFGGGGLIPVRRAFDRLVGDGWALLGNSASQVFPAHGSGVAAGMRAAMMLACTAAEALANGGADKASLWPYAALYQRTRGALCASHEWIRRLSETLTPAETALLFSVQAIDARSATRSLACESVKLSPRSLFGCARAAARNPGLVSRLIGAGTRVQRTLSHYERYPERWDPDAFAWWSAKTARLFAA